MSKAGQQPREKMRASAPLSMLPAATQETPRRGARLDHGARPSAEQGAGEPPAHSCDSLKHTLGGISVPEKYIGTQFQEKPSVRSRIGPHTLPLVEEAAAFTTLSR